MTASLRRRRMSVCISVFTVAVPVNYTGEFNRNLFSLISEMGQVLSISCALT